MFLTSRLSAAIAFASQKHDGQRRKSDGYPFIAHPFAVASILIKYGADESTIIAGLLHDTLEDTDCSPEELEFTFGPNVLRMVEDVSENKSLKWKDRKINYIDNLKLISQSSLMISCADKTHNLHTFLEELERHGESLWKKFPAGPEVTFWFFRSVHEQLKIYLDHPMVGELSVLVEKIPGTK
ncbi:MAG TPA: HD domain-containing protein [Candidatus Gracilibacteria bacterium]